MQLRLLKRALVQIATAFVLIVAAFLGYATIATQNGKSKAEALCQIIPVGTAAESAQAAITSAGNDPWLYFYSPERMSNGFYGALKERWICSVVISNGRVIDNEVRLID